MSRKGRYVPTQQQAGEPSPAPVWSQGFSRRPILMHPVVFVTAYTLTGTLFALQEFLNLHHAGYKIRPAMVFESWGAQYFLWGVTCWVLWRLLRPFIQNATVFQILTIVVPVSLVTCLIEEMIWVIF